jgi:methyltransferase family protein
MSTARAIHWDAVHRERTPPQTSWFRPHLDESLRLVEALDLPAQAPLIDIGGGRSTLVDDLLARGFHHLTVLDIAAGALADAKARLGAQAPRVRWLTADVTRVDLPHARYALWHDRAAFHFLVDAAERNRYRGVLAHALRADGHAILATFAADGPQRCSGLHVRRYDADALAAEFAPLFEPVAHSRELHQTQAGVEQPFTYVVLRRRARA